MSADAATGRSNVVIADRFETFDHQVPVDRFIEMLKSGDVPDEVCVLGLGETFANDEERELSRAMQDRAMDLTRENATIQFAVEGSIQPVQGGYELLYEESLYPLNKVFGADISEEEEGWLVASF